MSKNQDDLRDILARRLNRFGLGGPARAAYICQVADRIGAGRFTAIRFQRDVLTVRVASSVEAHELTPELPKIKKELLRELSFLTDLQIRITLT